MAARNTNVRTMNGSTAAAAAESINIDAMIAAEREAKGERPSITWRGRVWALPWDVPWAVADRMVQRDVMGGLAGMLGEDVRVLDPPVGIREAELIMEAIHKTYGINAGE